MRRQCEAAVRASATVREQRHARQAGHFIRAFRRCRAPAPYRRSLGVGGGVSITANVCHVHAQVADRPRAWWSTTDHYLVPPARDDGGGGVGPNPRPERQKRGIL